MAGPQYRQKLQPRSMQANINSYKNRIRRDPDSIYRASSPAGNQYDIRRFNVVDSNMTQGIRQKQVNGGPIDLKTMAFENTYFTNPRTGHKFGDSMAEGPSGWLETRHIYPDASGYGSYYDEEGNYSEYPIQLKGPQTWNYDPADRSGIMQMADSSVFNTMKEGYDFINDHYNIDDNRINYEWNKPLWGGNLNIGGEYDLDDDDYKFGINWGTTFG